MSEEIVEDVVCQHAEDAASLWCLRERAVRSASYSLDDLARLDERLEAHLDGLRIAGKSGWALCQSALETGEAGEYFAASFSAFAGCAADRIAEVLARGAMDRERSRGIIAALGWLPWSAAEPCIRELLASRSPTHRRIGVAAAAVHRRDPSSALVQAMWDPDPSLRARSLKAVGELGRSDLLDGVRAALAAEDRMCRFWAATSAVLLGDLSAVEVLQTYIVPGSPLAESALDLAMRCLEPQAALALQRRLADSPATLPLAVLAARSLGDPALISWLLERMSELAVARRAGEAFAWITGVDLEAQALTRPRPADFEPGPSDDPADEDVTLDGEEDLPWLDPDAIAAWWDDGAGRLPAGVRHLRGAPFSAEHLIDVLCWGSQRQRAAAALERSLRAPGTPLFAVRAPARRQIRELKMAPPLPRARVAAGARPSSSEDARALGRR